ncbi:SDR family oxidoreductase [Azospirillum halopraeferens]|uniref:SDR family oxidoreductase n=1 Tax=Azospirillum halopraeferens TaxID=34010 RepID=UPI000408814F|nr:SDR family oxidoreductase [Azospirillum halopraeferens]
MRVHLKPIEDQVIVITGASSGIGLVTARMAARRGAQVMLAARDGAILAELAEEIRRDGGTATHCAVDVGDEEDVRRLARTAIETFGRIDTWVNNAGVSIYGRIEEIPVAEARRLFDTDYWGVVHGSLAALPHLRAHGGSLINVGSVVSIRAIPLQGHYAAAKHAVKGFTDALRMELEAEDAGVSVTLIKPTATDTLFEEHGRNHFGTQPMNPPPLYAPETVAAAILHAAQTPVRDLVVGGAGKMFQLAETFAPRLTDRIMSRYLTRYQRSGGAERHPGDSLWAPSGNGRERAGLHGYVRGTSLYTQAEMHPWATVALFAGLGAIAAAAFTGTLPRPGRPAPARGAYRRVTAAQEFGHGAKPAGQAATEDAVTFVR